MVIRVASGYRPGGVNALNATQIAQGAPATFKPDTLTNYEVGEKGSFLGGALTTALSVYDIEWKNVQLLAISNGSVARGNGGKARPGRAPR